MTTALTTRQAATYAWRLDVWPAVDDLGPLEPPGTVIEGPSDAPDAMLRRLADGEGEPFQMRDDDGFVYCQGRILLADEDDDDDLRFSPLDDYGTPGMGCTSIQYLEETAGGGSAWQTL